MKNNTATSPQRAKCLPSALPLGAIALVLLVVLLFVANLYLGSIRIPAREVTRILFGAEAVAHPSWKYIIVESRLPAAVTALLCGASLASAGLMLQTALRNPLAGPSILGIDSGANLGVALVTLAAGGMLRASGITLGGFFVVIIAALLGALAVIALLLLLNRILRDNVMLLISGVMISYIAGSLISLLNYKATEEGVHTFMLWGLGSFRGMSIERLPYFTCLCLLGLALAVLLIKPLNALLLGENYAHNLGINIRRTRSLLLLTTGLLTAACTAFCGPVTFIGLAVPHLTRMFLRSANHRILLPMTMLCGASLALLCSLLSTLPGESSLIPINVLTPIIGAPTVIYVILKLKRE